jgi:hypothetical protein
MVKPWKTIPSSSDIVIIWTLPSDTKFILDVDEAVPLAKKKRIYGQQIDASTAMIRLFGGEVLDIPSQNFNITSGSDIQEDNTNLKIVISEGSVQIITISEDELQ